MYRIDAFSHPVGDLAELAARLGSIVTFDGRGSVFWFDEFEDGLHKWFAYGSGTGNAQTVDQAAVSRGMYAAKLVTGTTISKNSNLVRYFPYPALGKWGVETSFNATTGMTYTLLSVGMYDGTTYHRGNVRYDWSALKLQYQDTNGDWQDIATGVDLPESDFLFHILKVVLDFDNDLFVRVLLNHLEYDLSSIAMRTSDDSAGPYTAIQIQAQITGVVAQTTLVDYVIVTRDEP